MPLQNDLLDIVIVGSGAVLPDAENPSQFIDNAMAGKSAVCDMSKFEDQTNRQQCGLVYDRRRGFKDSSYTLLGAPINRRRLNKIALDLGLPLEENLAQHIMAAEVVRQCTQNILPAEARRETDFIFGQSSLSSDAISMYFKETAESIERHGGAKLVPLLEAEYERFKPYRKREQSAESLSRRIATYFGFGGFAMQVDAACASSLVAMQAAVLRLRAGLCRYAVIGGVDESLGSACTFVSFSQLTVLSETPARPFDKRSDGMVIGEGAAAFLLTTLAEAKRAGLPALAIIKGIGGSSDGRQGGLTEPTIAGQALCYKRAYDKNLPERMSFIEAHGTGTKVGDRAEVDSLMQFFYASPHMLIGSSKWNVGHTMSAAGAVGVLRALGVIERGMAPPSPYFEEFAGTKKVNLTINKKPVFLERNDIPLNVGVSSFGFGGANYHVWLREYKESEEAVSSPRHVPEEVVLCAETEASIADVAGLFRSTSYKLPPKAWPFIDKIQLLSVLLAEKIFNDSGINAASLDRDTVHVLAGAGMWLELYLEMTKRIMMVYSLNYIAANHSDQKEKVAAVGKSALAEFTELNDQFILGGLANLIPSRVTKAFNFRGVNFTVDADLASGLAALETARLLLQSSKGAALVFDVIKEGHPGTGAGFKGTGMRCSLIASLSYALEYNLPIKARLGPLEIERKLNAAA